jgi:hypothetical protein
MNATTPKEMPSGASSRNVQFDPPLVVAEFDRNSRERIRITLDRYLGRNTVDVRCWYRDGDTWKPTRSGLTTQVAKLPELVKGLVDALERAREVGLLPEQDKTAASS